MNDVRFNKLKELFKTLAKNWNSGNKGTVLKMVYPGI
jgi:hypothetical protein